MSQLDLALSTDVRDKDLLDRIDVAGDFDRIIVRRRCIQEQKRRDELRLMRPGQRRRAEMFHQIHEHGGGDRDHLRHIHSVLGGCSLPLTAPPTHVREWERRVGKMSLVVTAGKLLNGEGQWIDQPLPSGSRARLLMLHTCSEAIRQKSATIDIQGSLTGFIRSMGFTVTGGKNGTLNSFKQQVNALAASTMKFGMWDGDRAKTINTQLFTSTEVWLPTAADQKMMWPKQLTFSHEFYSSLVKHALPVNVHAVKAFASSPRKLDLVFWLGYRLASIKTTVHIPWDSLQEQWGTNYSRATNFKRDFAQEIAQIKEVFPKLPVAIGEYGVSIEPGGTEVLAIPRKR